jgi:hypothetical protein
MVVVAVLMAGCTTTPDREASVTEASVQASQVPVHMSATPAPTPTPTAATSNPGIPESSPPPITVPPETLQTPETTAARAFVHAIDAREYDDAWDLLGPRSQEALGSREALQDYGSALTERWGAWARSPDALIFSSGPLTDIDEDHPHSLNVVTLTGTVTRYGTTEQRTVAVPAWVEHERGDPVRAWLEPFAEAAPPLTIVEPVEGGTVACDDVRVVAEAPAERGGTSITLDGEARFPDINTEPADPHRFNFQLVAARLSPGEHVVTFAFVTNSLALYADAVRFTIEGPC